MQADEQSFATGQVGPSSQVEPNAWIFRLLQIPHTVNQSERPAELLAETARLLAEELRARYRIVWLNGAEEIVRFEGANLARLVVSRKARPAAVVELERDEPFDAREAQVLEQLELALSARFEVWASRLQDTLLEELRTTMRAEVELDEMSSNTVKMMVQHFGAEAGMLLLNRRVLFEVQATVGEWARSVEDNARYRQYAHETESSSGPSRVSTSLLACPIGTTSPARCVLLLRFPSDRQLLATRWPALEEASDAAAPYLDARWRETVLHELLSLNQATEESSSEEMYDLVLNTALTLIPGADSGTLLTRTAEAEPFVFQAARGFELDLLRRKPLLESEVRDWYGLDREGWQSGHPRVLRRDELDIAGFGLEASPGLNPAAQYSRIAASLCLPVLRGGVVMAVLNLENMTDPNSFRRDSREIARLFGPPLASLLHRQRSRDLLRHAALTDELTGLANRRAFNDSLRRELAREGRGGVGTCVLMLDMRDLKQLNDRHGHAAGDQALVLLAKALRSCLREADLPARWGGDELAAILVDTAVDEAAAIAARVRAAVSELEVAGETLTADIGIASTSNDGDTPESLVAAADRRMYTEKLGTTPPGSVDRRP